MGSAAAGRKPVTGVGGPDRGLRVDALGKSFPGIRALDGVSFDIPPGSVLGLVGENGAGKSTLIKILSGVYGSYDGRILMDGAPVAFASPLDAQAAGIATIFQELSLVAELSVTENVFLGREIAGGGVGLLDRRAMRDRTRDILARLGTRIDPARPVGELSIAQQQMVEICKALVLDSRIVIMDEPTSSLTQTEVDALFAIIRALRAEGRSVVYVSHKMDEVFAICDRIVVMRDGRLVSDRPMAETSADRVVAEMVGRELRDVFPERRPAIGGPVLTVTGLSRAGEFEGIDLTVHAGEVVALAGLVGAGRTELAKAIVGATRADAGTVRLGARAARRFDHPDAALRDGVIYLSEDRKGEGLMVEHPIRENISLSILGRLARWGLLDQRREREIATGKVRELSVKTRGIEAPASSLSGGNQQKVVLARLLATEAPVLILDEPTRGVDVGAKAEIYRLIAELSSAGRGVLLISSELPEILGLADRIAVIRDGRIAAMIDRADFDPVAIMTILTGKAA